MSTPRRPLVATYRIQLSPEGMDLPRVRQLVPYLRDLGISHVYLSPVLAARPGSTHGYDQVDPTAISASLGGEEALRALAAEIGVVLDIVPNHMGADDTNPWWTDPDLRERFFDVDPETGRWRRFFDIDDLAALRMEDPEVFTVLHAAILPLVADGVVDGLRIDHPDGLSDPAGYLHRLREAAGDDVEVWVEKILHVGEPLRTSWPVSGTVGYEFLDDVTALFVDPRGEAALTRLWEEVSGDTRAFDEVAAEAKAQQAAGPFRPEVERLARTCAAAGLAVSVEELTEAVASFPIYRTYVDPATGLVTDDDRAALDAATMPAALRAALTLDDPGHDEVVVRFQQTTPAVVAKGVEDTAFYRYLRLLALNEVGGDPGRFGLSVDAFHRANEVRAEHWPRNLLVSSTHDTKRSADVRARIGLLATHAEEWAGLVAGWREVTADLVVDGAPDGAEQLLVLQTLLGAWPIDSPRLEEYLLKALREAKRNTAWVDGDEAWEQGVVAYATALLDHEPFLATFTPFQERVAEEAAWVSLAQVLLKLTSPGVPDVYQGDELEDLSLVDPDNRRPVDWELRAEAVRSDAPPPKLALIRAVLALRHERLDVFSGAYRALDAGPDVCAFTRGDDDLLVVVPVRPQDAGDASVGVPSGHWRDVLAGPGAEPVERSGPVEWHHLVDPDWGLGLHLRT